MRRGVGALLAVLVLGGAGCGSPARSPAASTTDAYRVVYRVDDRSGPEPRITAVVVEVDRPFRGRVESRFGGRITTGQVTNREFFWQLGSGGTPEFGVRRAPAGSARDISYPALLDAARYGRAKLLGHARLLGRRCVWFTYGKPAPEPLTRPTRASRIESCVDASGILLAEVWTVDGRAVRITRATAVHAGALSSKRFLIGRDPTKEPVRRPEALRLLLTQFAVDDRAAVDLPTALRVPAGWERERRAIVSAAATGGRATQFVVESFVDEGELVVVERGVRPELEPPWQPDEGTRLELGALGSGRVEHFVDHVEIRLVGNVGFVRVSAPTRRIALSFVRGLQDRR